MKNVKISAILAMDNNQLIGNGDNLPWDLPNDMRHFRSTTLGKPVIMGRKTFDSIGKALPKRTNIVITRDVTFERDAVVVLHSIESLLLLIKMDDDDPEYSDMEYIIIGGAELIEQCYEHIDNFYITHIDHEFDGATTVFVNILRFKYENSRKSVRYISNHYRVWHSRIYQIY